MSSAAASQPLKLITLAVDYLPDPAWSPDSLGITYIDLAEAAVYLIGADGSNRQRFTPAPAGYQLTNIAWSPDGQRLAIHAWSLEVDKPHYRVFTVNADGTNLTPLYDDDLRGGAAFAAGGPFFNDDLYIVNADGSNLTQLTLKGVSNIERIQWGRSVKER